MRKLNNHPVYMLSELQFRKDVLLVKTAMYKYADVLKFVGEDKKISKDCVTNCFKELHAKGYSPKRIHTILALAISEVQDEVDHLAQTLTTQEREHSNARK